MIDIENEVMTIIYDAVHTAYPATKFESVLNLTPSEFPCVCVEEINNVTNMASSDSFSNENHAVVTYEVNIFTNDVSGKKQTAKGILALIDNAMLLHGFIRQMRSPMALDNGTKYRLVTRYQAVVSTTHTIYRR